MAGGVGSPPRPWEEIRQTYVREAGMITRCRGKLAQIALVVLGATLLASYSSDNDGKKPITDTSNKRAGPARFEPGPCPQTPEPVPGFDKASCGVLIVPENRQNDNGRTIRLAVVRVPAAVPHTPPLEPILFLAGGPGNSALLDAYLVTHPDIEGQRDHDVIFMSARGTWGSTPVLTCRRWRISRGPSPASRMALMRRGMGGCVRSASATTASWLR